MISMNKSYEENISREENKCYTKLVEKLALTGEIDDKYKLLMNTQTTINVVLLGLVYVNDINGNQQLPHISTTKKAKTEFERIGTLFSSLSQNIREQMIFSLGLEFVVKNGIDEIEPFFSTLKEVAQRRCLTGTIIKPPPLPNLSTI